MKNNHIDSAELLSTLAKNTQNPLVFRTGSQNINPGYHVTEIKKAQVASMDCGRGTDHWLEVVIQLLDGKSTSTQKLMSTDKFIGIASSALATLPPHKLYFEFSPGNGALLKMQVESIRVEDDQNVVVLSALAAECKPMLGFLKTGTSCC